MLVINFVNENPTKLLNIAYNSIDGLDLGNVGWCTSAEIKKKYKSYQKDCYFILSIFDGETFDYLRNLNMSIFGPQVIVECLASDISLPKMNIPILSTALKDTIICFTALELDDRDNLSSKVEMMFGTVSKDLTIDVNVLISCSVGTKKFRVAAQNKIPVLFPSWVNEVWSLSSNNDAIYALEETLMDKHRIPIFYNLKICVSGLDSAERVESEKVIIKNGGEYYNDLISGKCTHLVAKFAIGKKFDHAKKWKIQTVSWKWLYDSIEKGYALDENDYLLNNEDNLNCMKSTPNNKSQISFYNGKNDLSDVECTRINETNASEFNDDIGLDSFHNKIWENCLITFLECEQEFIDKWSNIIEENGGKVCRTEYDNVVEQITHIIVGKTNVLSEKEEGINYINKNWLQECIDKAMLVGVDPFNVEVKIEIFKAPEVINFPNTDSWGSMSQYFNSENTQIENIQSNMNQHNFNQSNFNQSNCSVKPDITTIVVDKTIISSNDNNSSNNNRESGIFTNCKFIILDSVASSQRNSITSLIVNNNGIIIHNLTEATHYVTPEIISRPIKLISNLTNVVTVFYLESCIKDNSLLSIYENYLFTPIIYDASCYDDKILSNCVLSFSGYPIEERKLLKSITNQLGAIVQDQMARKPILKKKILATTHLIISKVDKKKYPSSISWNIPAVTKEWIEACVNHNKLVDTANFVLDPNQFDGNMSVMTTCTTSVFNDTHSSINDITEMNINVNNDNNNMSITPKKRISSLSPTNSPVSINNKHLQIRNNNVMDISLGDLNSPIMRSYSIGKPRKFNIDAACLKTPEFFQPRKRITEPTFTTPEMTKALKSRLALLDIESKMNPSKYNDMSLSELDPDPILQPLHSVIVYILESDQPLMIREIVDNLGGQYSFLYESKTVTHVICSMDDNGDADISDRKKQELQKAIIDGKIIVSGDWLLSCQTEKRRVEESSFLVNVNEISSSNCSSITRNNSNRNDNSRKRKADNDDLTSCNNDQMETMEIRPPNSKRKLSNDISGQNEIQWSYKDKRLSNNDYDMEETELPLDNEDNYEEQSRNIIIMLSGIDKDNITFYEKEVTKLGGVLDTSKDFSINVTHLICNEPGRNPKYLSAIASGKWVLHRSFLDQSIALGKWQNEEIFEWGGPRNNEFIEKIAEGKENTKLEIALAEAAKRLREFGGKAFGDWRVCLIDTVDKAKIFANIITCGGGTVLPSHPLPLPSQITHLLVSKTELPNFPNLSSYLCYKVEFLSHFLAARSEKENKYIVKKFLISPKDLLQATEVVKERPKRSSRTTKKF